MTDVNEDPRDDCPRCGSAMPDRIAHASISRTDGRTRICPPCGALEALEDHHDGEPMPQGDWGQRAVTDIDGSVAMWRRAETLGEPPDLTDDQKGRFEFLVNLIYHGVPEEGAQPLFALAPAWLDGVGVAMVVAIEQKPGGGAKIGPLAILVTNDLLARLTPPAANDAELLKDQG